MHSPVIEAAEAEIERLGAIIAASEPWSKQYEKDPESHAGIISVEAKMERLLRRYFRELSDRVVERYINWYAYQTKLQELQAARVQADDSGVSIDLIFDEVTFKDEPAALISTILDPVAAAVALGGQSGETIYQIPIGLSQTHEAVLEAAQNHVAELVGKRINKNGDIVDNPNADYSIDETTRIKIRKAIQSALANGEDQDAASARIKKLVTDPKRAENIAHTEAVNSFSKGLMIFGEQSGAVGKEWQGVPGKCALCGGNVAQGIIPINQPFQSGHQRPAAHNRCRCGLRLVYQAEIDKRGWGNNSPSFERPNADENAEIERLLNRGTTASVRDAIEIAKTLPKEDAIAMMRAITYDGRSVVNDFYTVQLDPKTRKIMTVLKDPAQDPLQMTANELMEAAGIPLKRAKTAKSAD